MLNELGPKLEQTPINTKGFESMLGLVETTCSDSFELFPESPCCRVRYLLPGTVYIPDAAL